MLVICPECGREGVSNKAKACPDCAFPIAETPDEELTQSKTNPSSRSESTQTRSKSAHAKIQLFSAFYPGNWSTIGWIWVAIGGITFVTSPISGDIKTIQGLISGTSFILFAPFIRYYADRSYFILKQWGICLFILVVAGLVITMIDPDKSLNSGIESDYTTKFDVSQKVT